MSANCRHRPRRSGLLRYNQDHLFSHSVDPIDIPQSPSDTSHTRTTDNQSVTEGHGLVPRGSYFGNLIPFISYSILSAVGLILISNSDSEQLENRVSEIVTVMGLVATGVGLVSIGIYIFYIKFIRLPTQIVRVKIQRNRDGSLIILEYLDEITI